MQNLILRLRQLFGHETAVTPTPEAEPDNGNPLFWPVDALIDLVASAGRTEADDYACEDCDRLLAQFTEAIAAGEPATAVMPRVQKHLETCSPCREEFEALLQVLEAQEEG